MNDKTWKEYKEEAMKLLGDDQAIEFKNKSGLSWKEIVKLYSIKPVIDINISDEVENEWNRITNKQSFEGVKETIVKPISNLIPFRTPKKIKNLYPNITSDELKSIKKYNDFDLTKSKNKYQLKVFSKHKNVFMGDIFFSNGNKSAFLIFINVNTRYAIAEQLGFTRVEKYIDVDSQTENIQLKYSTQNRKTIQVIKKAFENILNQIKISRIIFDGEPSIRSQEFQEFLETHNIEINDHKLLIRTSLSIIDRFCRTIRDMAFTMNLEILSQEDMNQTIYLYNKCRHETLTRILYETEYLISIGKIKYNPISIETLNERFPNGISPNDVNNDECLEMMYISYCMRHNFIVSMKSNYELANGLIVRIVEYQNKFSKKRSILSKDNYVVVEKVGDHFKLENERTQEIVIRPRFEIKVVK